MLWTTLQSRGSLRLSLSWRRAMGQVVTIGLDIAKSVFQVHGIDAEGAVVLRRQLRRAYVLPFFAKQPPCLIGVEACATAHHWARELGKLGHEVRLMPPSYVKAYLKRQKNDAADAEAICEAVSRPTMRFVEAKSPEQQSVMVLHRIRLMLIRQRIQLSTRFAATCRSSALSGRLDVRACSLSSG
jgi:transposase